MTTDSKVRNRALTDRLSPFLVQSDALRRENARLTRETNKLYVDLIRADERLAENKKQSAATITEQEVTNLCFAAAALYI